MKKFLIIKKLKHKVKSTVTNRKENMQSVPLYFKIRLEILKKIPKGDLLPVIKILSDKDIRYKRK